MYKVYADGQMICSSKIQELAIINPVVNMEANKAGTFSFTMPPTHPFYDKISRKSTLIDVYRGDDTEPLFEGICSSIDDDFFKQRKITCEGDLTFLNDSNLRPSRKQGLTSRQLLEDYINEHNSLVEAKKRFTVGIVTATDKNDFISCYTNYNSTMTEIKEDLIDDLGGYLRVRHENGVRYLDYLKESPRTNNQVVRLGFNLIDLSVGLNTDDLATVIIPLGTTLEEQEIQGLDARLTIKEAEADEMHPSGTDYVYSADAVENFGWIEKVIEWSDVTLPENLLAKGEKYLQETQFENLVIQAKAIDLGITEEEFQRFRMLDMIRVVSKPHGLDRYFMLTKMQVNLNNPERDTITLGIEKPNTLSAKSQSANEAMLREVEKRPTSNLVKSIVANATALITGAEGGFVVIETNADGKPIELKIQDALNNPTKIWRWNINGLGYSNDGGETYGLAMTMDGSIVANFIASGTMYADRIKGGTLSLGGLNNEGGVLEVKNANGDVIGQWTKDGITIVGGSIQSPAINGGSITGNSISGGTLSGTTISGGSINIGGNFSVNSNGECVTRVLTVGGTISSLAGAVTINGNFVTTSSLSAGGHGDFGDYVSAREFIQSSDRNLKDEIEDIDDDKAIEFLSKLQAKQFVLKSDPETRHTGFIAQDVQEAIKECSLDETLLVSEIGTDDNKHLGLNYSDMIAFLVKGYQSQQQEIELLKKEIQELKGE